MASVNFILSEHAGFCGGVKRAYDVALNAAKKYKSVFILGELVHNKDVCWELESFGIETVNTVSEIPDGGIAIIRSHGEPPETYIELERRGIEYIDCTCPNVKKNQTIIQEQTKKRKNLIYIGNLNHPECVAATRRASKEVSVKILNSLGDLPRFIYKSNNDFDFSNSFCLFQTTSEQIDLKSFFKKLLTKSGKYCIIRLINFYDTICMASRVRQIEAENKAAEVDIVIVFGEENSSNSKKIFEAAKKVNPQSYFTGCVDFNIESIKDRISVVSEKKNNIDIFVTSGASVPKQKILKGISAMSEILDNVTFSSADEKIKGEGLENLEENSEFREFGENSGFEAEDNVFLEFMKNTQGTTNKKVRLKQTTTGKVIDITDSEIFVDIKGAKQSAYIPASEYGSFAENLPEIGDPIEAVATTINEQVGEIRLSRRLFESTQGMKVLERAFKSNEKVVGNVFRVQPNGILASVDGAKIFVPSGLTGYPYGKKLDELLNTTMEFKIVSLYDKGRVIGSIKDFKQFSRDGGATDIQPGAENAYKKMRERRASAAKFWETAKELLDSGEYIDGIVRNTLKYGAFVDMGGVDGLLHISELSWGHVQNVDSVLKPGEHIKVYIKSIDFESKKISLGYKDPADNPWSKFLADYKVGDDATAEVVSIKTYGAFARIAIGDNAFVDALIHLSAISDKTPKNVNDVLKVGQIVNAKVSEIDVEKQRINLSIRNVEQTGFNSQEETEHSE